MSDALQMFPISFEKLTLSACQQLLTYLIASAVLIGTTFGSTGIAALMSRSTSTVASSPSSAPMITVPGS